MRDELKYPILKLIFENKDILFGPYDQIITPARRTKTWEEIYNRGKEMRINLGKNSEYFRHTTWQNWRRRVLEKYHNDYEYPHSKCSKLILDIIGKGNISRGIVKRRRIRMSSASSTSSNANFEVVIPENNSNLKISSITSLNVKQEIISSPVENPVETDLAQKKNPTAADLEIEKKLMENYRMRLELIQMELALELPPSEFTKELREKIMKPW